MFAEERCSLTRGVRNWMFDCMSILRSIFVPCETKGNKSLSPYIPILHIMLYLAPCEFYKTELSHDTWWLFLKGLRHGILSYFYHRQNYL